jgi:hypothetical protein
VIEEADDQAGGRLAQVPAGAEPDLDQFLLAQEPERRLDRGRVHRLDLRALLRAAARPQQ